MAKRLSIKALRRAGAAMRANQEGAASSGIAALSTTPAAATDDKAATDWASTEDEIVDFGTDEGTPYAVTTEELQIVIKALGFKDYLLTLTDNLRAANTAVTRTAEMLRFFLVLAEAGAVIAAFIALDTMKLLGYLKHLKERLLRSNSTVYNTLLDIKSSYEWAIMLRAPEHLTTGVYSVTIIQMKRQLKEYRKKRKVDAVKIRYSSLEFCLHYRSLIINARREDLVEQRKLPEGGLEEMQQQMLRELERMMALTDAELWVEQEYYHAAGVVLAIMYLFSPQGRIKGIQTMLLRQAIEIFERGFTDTGNIVILI